MEARLDSIDPKSQEWSILWNSCPWLRGKMREIGRAKRNNYLKKEFLFLDSTIKNIKKTKVEEFPEIDFHIRLNCSEYTNESVYLRIRTTQIVQGNIVVLARVFDNLKRDETLPKWDWYQIFNQSNFMLLRYPCIK